MESWSGVLEWHVGVKFWSGMKRHFTSFSKRFLVYIVVSIRDLVHDVEAMFHIR